MNRFLTQSDLSVLRALLAAEAPLPIHGLSHAAGVSVDAAAAAIHHLAEAGCEIDRHPQHGHRLTDASIECWSDYIEAARMRRFGRRVLVYRRTASTQDVARHLIAGVAQPGDFDGYVIAADHQTAGRGRLGRTWHSRTGDQLLLTAIVADTPHPPDRLMLAAAVAVSRCVESFIGRSVELRWPNDVYVGDGKLAGILVEAGGETTLIGIGINVAGSPHLDAIDYPTTSINALGIHVDRLTVLENLCAALTHSLEETDQQLADFWRTRSGLRQERVTIRADGRELVGRVIDIDPAHGLVVEVERGPVVTLPAASTSIALPRRVS